MALSRIKLKIDYANRKAGDVVTVTPEVLEDLKLNQYEPLGTLMSPGVADISTPPGKGSPAAAEPVAAPVAVPPAAVPAPRAAKAK